MSANSSVPFQSHYMPNTPAQREEMLEAIGLDSIDRLFEDIPAEHRSPSLNIPPPTSELELRTEMEALAGTNRNAGGYASFLGAGVYNHFIPSIVKPLITRGEFLTSYTPYQAEASQGTLQVAYEFQTMICSLMGMEVANDGMYEGASSLAEAALMACRVAGREEIFVLNTVSPTYREVVETYALPQGLKVTVLDSVRPHLPEGAACLLTQYPNFFGYVEDLSAHKVAAQERDALLVVSTDPVAMGMFRPPGDFGADLVTGEGQALGVPMSFGGPFIGIFATRKKYLRQMPGRIVGRTVDVEGKTGYVLTLQTREQHIRRERATSNICTSQALLALASTIAVSALGKTGAATGGGTLLPQGPLRSVAYWAGGGLLFPHPRDLLQGIRGEVSRQPQRHQPAAFGERDYWGAGHQPRHAELHAYLRYGDEHATGDRSLGGSAFGV